MCYKLIAYYTHLASIVKLAYSNLKFSIDDQILTNEIWFYVLLKVGLYELGFSVRTWGWQKISCQNVETFPFADRKKFYQDRFPCIFQCTFQISNKIKAFFCLLGGINVALRLLVFSFFPGATALLKALHLLNFGFFPCPIHLLFLQNFPGVYSLLHVYFGLNN